MSVMSVVRQVPGGGVVGVMSVVSHCSPFTPYPSKVRTVNNRAHHAHRARRPRAPASCTPPRRPGPAAGHLTPAWAATAPPGPGWAGRFRRTHGQRPARPGGCPAGFQPVKRPGMPYNRRHRGNR